MRALTKRTIRLTTEAAALVLEMRCIVRIGQTLDGVEIRDTRPLAEQIEAPICGAGVVRHLGATRYIVTEARAAQLNAKPLPASGNLV
ncbi:hypothetical protein [Pseudomonas sp.]|uniref:hypothetical protein n=1 Tax=Pseudomonas sp. TaxID=306 RepID=UPI00290AAD3F|nr:hypothetical protein [Pseudomonas sp.]MDU4254523.1 hypothetical protein [Pseudomonas sp.]